MRAGTQTLIQALQAIPWTDDPDNDEDNSLPGVSSANSDNEEDETKPGWGYSLSNAQRTLIFFPQKTDWLPQSTPSTAH